MARPQSGNAKLTPGAQHSIIGKARSRLTNALHNCAISKATKTGKEIVA